MTCLLRRILASLATLLIAAHAHAYEAGWMQIQVAGTTPDAPTTTVALYYPTMAAPRAIAMGPFTLDVAIGGKPVDKVKALILLSHGIGGSELGHSVLAQALARDGYLVAALRHPGDNWQDRSLIEKSPERYFDERPRQASRVIDAILADPAWKDRIASDSQGPRVGALGHSAGGYTVLALAGARPDLSRIRKHCLAEASEDPIFCGMGRSGVRCRRRRRPRPRSRTSAFGRSSRWPRRVCRSPPNRSPRFGRRRMIYEAELDRFLVPRFHAEWVAGNLPAPNLHRVPNAWHFAFMDSPSMSIPSPDGDVAANPPGFDRAAFLKQLADEITAFFDKTLL